MSVLAGQVLRQYKDFWRSCNPSDHNITLLSLLAQEHYGQAFMRKFYSASFILTSIRNLSCGLNMVVWHVSSQEI